MMDVPMGDVFRDTVVDDAYDDKAVADGNDVDCARAHHDIASDDPLGLDDDGLSHDEAHSSCLDAVCRHSLLRIPITLLVVLSLVSNSISQSEYAQYEYSDLKYHSYYFLAWFTNSMSIVVFPAWVVAEGAWFFIMRVWSLLHRSGGAGGGDDGLGYAAWVIHRLRMNPKFSLTRYALVGIVLAGLNLFSAYTWYLSLDMIPVAINSALYRFTFIFVFILSVLFLQERITYWKVLALLFSSAGVLSTGAGDYLLGGSSDGVPSGTSPETRLIGYLLVVASAFAYACYEVFYRKMIGEANIHGIMLINSIMGFWCLIAFSPLVPILFFAKAEPIPDASAEVASFLIVNVAFAVSYYLLYAVGMSISSPLYISLSSLIGIPLAAMVDAILHSDTFSWLTIMGMCLVCVGVVFANVDHIITEIRLRGTVAYVAVDPMGSSEASKVDDEEEFSIQ